MDDTLIFLEEGWYSIDDLEEAVKDFKDIEEKAKKMLDKSLKTDNDE